MSRRNLRQQSENILGIEEATSLLSPHLDCLVQAAHTALEFYLSFKPEQLERLKRRTKKGILNDAMVDSAIALLDGVSGVKPNEDYEGAFLIFSGRLAVRYKYLSGDSCTSNVRTERQRKLDLQQLQLKDVSTLTVATFGYSLNAAWSAYIKMKLFCKRGNSILWHIPVPEYADSPLLPLADQHPSAQGGPAVRSTKEKRKEAAQ